MTRRILPVTEQPGWEVREDDDDELDELVLRDVKLVHLERLGGDQAYMQFHFDDGTWGQLELWVGAAGELRLGMSALPDDGA